MLNKHIDQVDEDDWFAAKVLLRDGHHSSKLLHVFGKKCGAQGRKIKSILIPTAHVKQREHTAKHSTVMLTFEMEM